MSNRVKNTCSKCVAFDPIVRHQSGNTLHVSQVAVLGAPILTIKLNANAETLVFWSTQYGAGTYSAMYLYPRAC